LVIGEDLHIVMHTLENKCGGYEPFDGGLNKLKINKMQMKKRVWLWGLGSH